MRDAGTRRFARTFLRYVLLPLWVALAAGHPAAAQSFAGTFADPEGMVLTLELAPPAPPGTLQPYGDRYAGTLVYDSHPYDLEAVAADGELHGSFATGNGSFELRARFVDEVLELESNTVTYTLRRTVEAGGGPAVRAAAAELPQAEPPMAEPPPQTAPADDGARDPGLFGVWTRQPIVADAGSRLPDAIAVELAPDGRYAVGGGAVERTGRWRTEATSLLLRPAGTSAWQPYCRYRVVADTLLCSFDDGSRQLWFRR